MAGVSKIIRLSSAIRTPALRPFSTSLQRKQTVPFEIDGSGNGVAQNIKVRGSSHQINTDTYPAFGGSDAAPSPLHFNLTSLSSCTQVTGSIVAKDHGVTLGKWEVSVEGQLDPKVLVAGEEGNANWNSIKLDVVLETDADQAKFEKFTSEVERRCPVTQLFKRSGVDWTSNWKNQPK